MQTKEEVTRVVKALERSEAANSSAKKEKSVVENKLKECESRLQETSTVRLIYHAHTCRSTALLEAF